MADNTKYRFEGQEYGKGRLVLAVLKYYVSQSAVGFESLKGQLSQVPFNGDIVVSQADYDQRLQRTADTERRYFTKDLLTDAVGGEFYVSNQWGIKNIDGFVICARKLGMSIEIIPDESSELMTYFRHYAAEPRSDWIESYRHRCGRLESDDHIDFSDETIIDDYWGSAVNGISNVSPGGLSKVEFERLKADLPEISRKISENHKPETHNEVMRWANRAKEQGKFTTVKRGVINRFFCACAPKYLSTILNYSHLRRFVEQWNPVCQGQRTTLQPYRDSQSQRT